MFNPENPQHVTRLRKAVDDSRETLEDAATKRMEAYERLVGHHYTKQSGIDQQPTNLIELSASILARNLAASCPRAMITPLKRDLRASAAGFGLALNKHLENTDLDNDMQVWVYESMFAPFGILKVCMYDEEFVELDGEMVAVGTPQVEPVLFDDWVHDMSARDIRQCAFYGHRFLVEKDWVLDHPLYDEHAKSYLTSAKDSQFKSSREIDSGRLSKTKNSFHQDYRDMVELWELYLPYEQLIITYSGEQEDVPPLRITEWTGPKRGPYHFLWFTPVPGNTLPLPPVAVWRDLHDLANALFCKLGAQAERQKQVGLVPGAQAEDAKRITDAKDGEWVHVEAAQKIIEASYGGINAGNLNMFLQTWQLFDKHAGNISALGGLGPMSGTVGQDKLLTDAAGARVQAMQDRVKAATRSVMESVGYYLWHDPLAEIPIEYRAQGAQETALATWGPENRQGDWYDYAIDIEPYSLQKKSPHEKQQFINEFFGNVVMPALPVLQAQGIMPNFEALVKLVAKLSNMPELLDLLLFTQGETLPTEEPLKMPSTTTRRYERVSRSSGMTDRGMAQQMGQMMTMQEPQPMMREVG